MQGPAPHQHKHSRVCSSATNDYENWGTCLHQSGLRQALVNRSHSSALGSIESRGASCLKSCCSFQNNCLASAKDFQWEPNGFFSLRLSTGDQPGGIVSPAYRIALSYSFFHLSFPSMHIHFQLITPCGIIILQGGQRSQQKAKGWACKIYTWASAPHTTSNALITTYCS